MSFEIGSIVGQYEIIERIGRGGMATVYRGRHTRLNRDVAIKVLHPMLNDDDSFLRRFSREAQLVAQLEHPHIVPIYDFAEHEHQPYLVMRLVEGDTLKERMTQGTLSRDEILRIAQAVADGLDYAHGQGVLHRDIKPSNIMLTSASGVYIADFGLARMAQAGESTLSQDMIMGTPQYISPEQAKGNKEIDGRTDLYSFGIILYELVTGQAPFQSETTYSIIHMQIFDAPPLPSAVNPAITPDMEAVLLKALDKEPGSRYETGRELVAAFGQAFAAMPEDFAPDGEAVLPDYTPVGVTRIQPEAKITPESETAVPPLPVLVTEEEKIESVEETAVPLTPPTKKKRSKWLIIGAVLLLFLLFSALAYGASQIGQEDDDPIAATDLQPISQNNEPLAGEPPSPEDPQSQPGGDHPLFMPPPRNVRPLADIQAEVAKDPNDPQLKAELAVAYLQNGHPEEARGIVKEMFSRIRLPRQFITTTDRLLENGNFELASLVLQEGLARFQEDPQLQHRLLMALILSNANSNDITQYTEFLYERESPESDINAELAEAYLLYQDQEGEAAIDTLKELAERPYNPFQASTYFLLGRLYHELNYPEAEQEAFQGAIAHEPEPWLMMQIDKQLNP